MPRLTESLQNLRNCKYRSINLRNKPIFRQILPAELKDTVRGRKDKLGDSCSREMESVLACFKKHDFESKHCEAEISKFQRCFTEMELKNKRQREMEAKGLIADEQSKLTRNQVNNLLLRHPQLRPRKANSSF